MKNYSVYFCFLYFLLSNLFVAKGQTIGYVKPFASGTGDGSSWANASNDIQATINALDAAPPTGTGTKELWVAAGTYFPGNTITSTFFVKSGIRMYGGFLGTETALSQRDFAMNITTLSGDLGMPNISSDNCYHIITAAQTSNTTTGVTIDGFTIRDGNANYASAFYYANNDTNLVIRHCSGGGIYILGGINEIANNKIFNNKSIASGGGIFIESGVNTIINNTIYDNSSYSNNCDNPPGGGGMCIINSTNTFTNNVIHHNMTYNYGNGGGILLDQCSSSFTNNTFYNNKSDIMNGGGVCCKHATTTFNSNSFYANIGEDGSAIYAEDTSFCKFINNAIYQNLGYTGAAIHCYGTTTLINNTVYANAANSFSAQVGGLFIEGHSKIINNIFWGNKINGNINMLGVDYRHISTATPDTVRNNIFQLPNTSYNSTSNNSLGAFINTNFFVQNPLFSNTTDIDGLDNILHTIDDGLHLLGGSPAKDAGINLVGVPNIDIIGEVRPQGAGIDIGAYEGEVCAKHSLYVDASRSVSGNGHSWATAYKTLDEAILMGHFCAIVDTIHVAEGVYIPNKKPYDNVSEITTTDPRDKTFHLPDGIVLYGGYPTGGGTRDPLSHSTILNGDIGIVGDSTDNCYHVVFAFPPANLGVTIDGFIITNGNANGTINGIAGTIVINGYSFPRNVGGGIFAVRGKNIYNNNTVYNNFAYIGGGIMGQAGNASGSTLLSNSRMYNNMTEAGGGGVSFYDDHGTVTLINNVFHHNIGGGIFLSVKAAIVMDNLLHDNLMCGGGYISANVITFKNNIIHHNTNSYSNGGGFGLSISNFLPASGVSQVTNNTIYANTASNMGMGGGGLFIVGHYLINLADNLIYSNTAKASGGGIYIISGPCTLINNTLHNNHTDYNGGGVCVEGNGYKCSLTSNSVYANTAGNYGAGIYASGKNLLTKNNIYNNNNALKGGGIYTNGTAKLLNNTIYTNSAIEEGGGIHASATDSLSSNIIYNNSSKLGGGIFLSDFTKIVNNNTLYANLASVNGGGICIGESYFVTSPLYNNLDNNLFWKNKNNTATNVEGADFCSLVPNNQTLFRNNLLQLPSSSYTTTGSGYYDLGAGASSNIFQQNPLFLNSAAPMGADNLPRTSDDGLQLTAASPALNTGNNFTWLPPTDCLGMPRIFGGTVDIGAYELQPFVGIDAPENLPIIIAPNPSSTGVFYINTYDFNNKQAVITNLLGQTSIFFIQDNQINLSDFPAGIYFLTIENWKQTFKLIKED